MDALLPIIDAWENTLRNNPDTFKSKRKELFAIHRCHPLTTFILPWIQLPAFIVTSLTLRHIAGFPIPWMDTVAPVQHLSVEGFAFFYDLTAVIYLFYRSDRSNIDFSSFDWIFPFY